MYSRCASGFTRERNTVTIIIALRSFTVSLLLSREMPVQILLCKPRPDHGQRENTGQERGEAQRHVVEADIDEGMHVASYDENPCEVDAKVIFL